METSIFTRRVKALLSDDEYRQLQGTLVDRPDQGALIQGSGGIRKVRWAAQGMGKRGGVRIIYILGSHPGAHPDAVYLSKERSG